MPILIPPGAIDTPPPAPHRMGVPLRYIWRGWDGSEWDIGDPQSGIRLGAGVIGLDFPAVDFYTDDSPAVDGEQDTGFRTPARDVLWPLRVYVGPGTSQEWLDYDRAFFNTLRPGKYGVWEVVQPSGEKRHLTLRHDPQGGKSFDTDPALIGWASYAVRLRASQPLWQVDDYPPRTFQAQGPGASFFGPDRHISTSNTLGSATMDNPGDVEAWPLWTLTGPFTSATISVDGHQIVIPFAATAGQQLVIDTSPQQQTAYLDATKRTGDLAAADYAAIQPGDEVPIGLTMLGTDVGSTVSVTITPRFYRAW